MLRELRSFKYPKLFTKITSLTLQTAENKISVEKCKLGSVSAAINTRAQLCSDQVLWGMGEDPKNSYHWSIYQKLSHIAQGMQESKETKAVMGASFQRSLHLL